ncbi:MAG: putative photosynthetic complex assembly protein PuhE [Pseudomonadota bacterium]
MTSPWLAIIGTIFVWWFSTGAILWRVKSADRAGDSFSAGSHMRDRAHLRSVLWGLPILGLGIWGFSTSLQDETITGVYVGFLSALAIWGWIELSFLSGIITGPNHHKARDGVPGWERFIRAWGTVAYHEMLLATALGLMLYAAWDAPNVYGLWTYIILFFARISAKLNLFFGVPRIHVEFLPSPLAHLASHFRRATLNWLFPVSITALTFAAACWLERIYASETMVDVTGFILLATLTSLALVEHWLMVLPVPDEKLWRWMIPAPKIADTKRRREDAHGL